MNMQQKRAGRLLCLLLALLLLTGAFSLTVLAGGEDGSSVRRSPSGESAAQGESALPDTVTSLPGMESSAVQQESSAPAGRQEDRAAAMAPFSTTYPVNTHQDILDAIAAIAGGSKAGHIQLQQDIRVDDTLIIPADVEIEMSGLVGDEKLLVGHGLEETNHLYVYGTLALRDIDISGEGRTGGIYAEGGKIILYTGARVGDNFKTGTYKYGGGLFITNGSLLEIRGGIVEDNLLVNTGNASTPGGAGIYANDSAVVMYSGTIRNNASDWGAHPDFGIKYFPGSGGGVFLGRSDFIMYDGEISGNSGLYGGGIYASGNAAGTNKIEILGGKFIGNGFGTEPLGDLGTYYPGGGAISVRETVAVTIKNTRFEENFAFFGGAMDIYSNGTYTVENCVFKGNYGIQGGAVSASNPNNTTALFKGCEFISNSCYRSTGAYGGALYISLRNSTSNLHLQGCLLEGNTVYGWGGGLYLSQDAYKYFTMENTTFRDNTTTGTYPFYFEAGFETWHDSNIQGTLELSFPFDLDYDDTTRLNRAYNNYDIFVGNWEPVSVYTVEVHVDDAWVYDILVVEDFPVKAPNRIEVPAGFALDGWYTANTYAPADKWEFDEPVEDNMQLYAQLVPVAALTQTVTFYRNDGTPAMHHSYEATVGAAVIKPADPVRPGYVFWKWTVGPAETSAGWDFTSPMPAVPLQLYAQYTAIVYRATFDYSQVRTSNQYEYQNATIGTSLAPMDTIAEGYTFIGWKYGAGYWSFGTGVMPGRNITLVGVWSKNGGTSPPQESSSSSAPRSSTSRPPASSGTVASSSSPAGAGEVSGAPPSDPPSPSGAAQSPEVLRDEPLATMNLFGFELPVGGIQSGEGWSLLNLVIALLLCASGGVQVALMLRRRNVRVDMRDLERSGARPGRRGTMRGLAAGTGALALVLWLVLENLGGAAMLLSRWTPLFTLLAVLHAALLVAVLVVSRGGKAPQ